MKRFVIALFVIGLMSSMALAAEDGAALYKSKCAMCHGPNGEGKSAPKLAGDALSADQIAAVLTKGAEGKKAPHGKPVAGLSADQASAVAAYVKTLK